MQIHQWFGAQMLTSPIIILMEDMTTCVCVYVCICVSWVLPNSVLEAVALVVQCPVRLSICHGVDAAGRVWGVLSVWWWLSLSSCSRSWEGSLFLGARDPPWPSNDVLGTFPVPNTAARQPPHGDAVCEACGWPVEVSEAKSWWRRLWPQNAP